MTASEYACVFVRAGPERLVTAERFVLALPSLLAETLLECDLAHRLASRFLVVTLRIASSLEPARRDRLAFWAARAGTRATPLSSVGIADVHALRQNVAACELKVERVTPSALFEASGRFFTAAGAPADRYRDPSRRPVLVMDVGGPGWDAVTYRPEEHRLFIAAPLGPPAGDTIQLALRVAGIPRPFDVRGTVSDVRTTSAARAGLPAGYGVRLEAIPPELEHELRARSPATHHESRTAPRFHTATRVKVIGAVAVKTVPPEELAPAFSPAPIAGFSLPPVPASAAAEDPAKTPVAPMPIVKVAHAPPPPHASVEYATEQELVADYVENLSQGGALVRTAAPLPVGSRVALELKLPNGQKLSTRAVVVFVDEYGMGVRFTLDREAEAVISSAIAHISARPRRALVVDDDALVRRMLSDALQERGFEVVTANDGASGLQALTEELLALDLLVTDLKMPTMDGEAFVRTIRNAGGEADLAIVAITGSLEPGLEAKLEAAGADAVLEKTLGPELIAQAADAVLERKRVVRQGA